MPLPSPTAVSDNMFNVQMANITAATVTYIPLTRPGRVKRIAACPTVVTATGSATFQVAYAPPGSSTFTDITGALITMPSGTAAGVTIQQDVASNTGYVQDGGTLRITMGGTATGGGTPQVTVNVGN